LQEKISKEESEIIAKAVKQTLTALEVLQIVNKEEQIMETGTDLNITFYVASYVYFAKEKELQLITGGPTGKEEDKLHL
jgi:predicted nucleic acid-binding protein